MLIDFTKLQEIIPADGSITLTIKKNLDGKLGVLFQSKHNLKKSTGSTYEKDLKGQQDNIEAAKKELDKVLGWTDTPEVLTATFRERINVHAATARSLAEAVNNSTDALNARIKELADKKVAKSPAAKKGEASKPVELKKEEPARGASLFDTGLFAGSVGGSTPTSSSGGVSSTAAPAAAAAQPAGAGGDSDGASDGGDDVGAESQEEETEELGEVA